MVARESAKCLVMHTAVFTAKNYPVQNVNSAETEKSWCGAKARFVDGPV